MNEFKIESIQNRPDAVRTIRLSGPFTLNLGITKLLRPFAPEHITIFLERQTLALSPGP